MTRTGHGRGLLVAAFALCIGGPAAAQGVPEVPRNQTLISQGWDFYNQVPTPENFNPYAGVLLHQRNDLHYTVNEQLFYTNHNTNELIPWQAESLATSDDYKQITIKLRPGVLWSDGKPFTADDVVFTFAMLKAAAPDLLFSGAIAEWVASAEATDPATVVIKLTKPGPRWAADFLATGQATRFVVVPKHIWEGQNAKTFNNFDLAKGWPVGTGPFKLVKSDSNSVFFDRRDSWWAVNAGLAKAMPGVRRVVYVPATAEAMPQLFAGNQIDLGRSIQPGAFEAIRAQNPRLISWNKEGPVWGAPDGCTIGLRFNTQSPPFDKAEVRQAVNAAINRDQIVNLAFEGAAPKVTLPFASYTGMKAYTEALTDLSKPLDGVDAKKVASAMAAAGYAKDGGGMWAAGGTPLKVELQVGQGDPTGPVLTQQLRSAGFDTVLSVKQITAQTEALAAGSFQMSVYPHCGSLYDPWQTLEHFHGKYAAAAGTSSKNLRAPTRYKNAELDAILDQMERTKPSPQDAKYKELVRQAVAIFARDLPEIPLVEEFHTLVFNTTYWDGWATADNPYVAPFPAWEGFALVVDRLTPRR